MTQYTNQHHSGIPILGRYIDSWRFAFVDKTDGLGKARLNVLLGNYALTLISAVTAGIFYTQLFLMMFAEVPEETRVLTQNNYTSIINGLASAAGFLQLLSPFVFERLKKRKTLIFTFYGIYHFLDIVLLPACLFLPFDVITRANIFVVVMTMRTALTSLASPGFSAWHIAYEIKPVSVWTYCWMCKGRQRVL